MALERLKVSVIGGGYWGINIIRNIYALGALESIVEPNIDIHPKIKKIAPGIVVHRQYREVLQNKNIDTIMISTPAVSHYEMIIEAIDAKKKNIFVEKPLCLDLKDGKKILEKVLGTNIKIMVGHLLLYHPAFLSLKKEVDRGRIGKIRYIYSNRLSLGKLRRDEDVLWSFAPHDISMILNLVKKEPLVVKSFGGSYLSKNIADTSITLLKFSNNIKAHLFVSWLHPYKDQKLIVIGEKGMLVFADNLKDNEKLMFYDHKIGWENNMPIIEKKIGTPVEYDASIEPLSKECRAFLDWILNGIKPPSDLKEGLKVLEVLEQAKKQLMDW